MFDAVETFNQKAAATPASGCSPAACSRSSTATVVDDTGERAGHHRRPLRRDQGVPRRLLGHRGPRPRRRAGSGPTEGSKACARHGRGPAVPGRDLRDRGPGPPPPASSGSTARSTAGWSPRWPAASATSTSPRTPRPRRCSSPVERWPVDGVPPNPGGWLTTTAGNRAIDRIRRESHRDAKHQAAADDPRRHPARADRHRSRTTGCG